MEQFQRCWQCGQWQPAKVLSRLNKKQKKNRWTTCQEYRELWVKHYFQIVHSWKENVYSFDCPKIPQTSNKSHQTHIQGEEGAITPFLCAGEITHEDERDTHSVLLLPGRSWFHPAFQTTPCKYQWYKEHSQLLQPRKTSVCAGTEGCEPPALFCTSKAQ